MTSSRKDFVSDLPFLKQLLFRKLLGTEPASSVRRSTRENIFKDSPPLGLWRKFDLVHDLAKADAQLYLTNSVASSSVSSIKIKRELVSCHFEDGDFPALSVASKHIFFGASLTEVF